MYVCLSFEAMDGAMARNMARLRASTHADGRPMRVAQAITVPKMGKLSCGARVGPAYDDETMVSITLDTIQQVCAFVIRNTYVRVGDELRKMLMGTPMGEPGSCAQANGVCLDAEQSFVESRELTVGDSERVCTVGFMDDLHFRLMYDLKGILWTKESAEAMMRECESLYPAPLSLE
jgi:hypothetical protein